MRVGSLCTGYGGLDLALGGETVWVSEIDKHAAIVVAARFPHVPNLGDLTKVCRVRVRCDLGSFPIVGWRACNFPNHHSKVRLKILGNGVVPQQAALALDVLTRRRAAAVA